MKVFQVKVLATILILSSPVISFAGNPVHVIAGGAAIDLISAMNSSGVALRSDGSLVTGAVVCAGYDGMGAGADPSSVNFGVSGAGTCNFVDAQGNSLGALSEGQWILTDLGNAGLPSDNAMGGRYGYDASSIHCKIDASKEYYIKVAGRLIVNPKRARCEIAE